VRIILVLDATFVKKNLTFLGLQLLAAILFQILQFIVRSSSDLHLLSLQTAVGKKLIKFKTSQLWNKLPDQLKQIRSLNSFKQQLKNYLLNKIC